MNDFPSELRLLLFLLRSALGTAEGAVPPIGDIEWRSVLLTVERHRVGAFLHHRASAQLRTVCPEAVAERLKAVSTATTQRALLNAVEQHRLTRDLKEAGIKVLAVKGLALAQQLYGGLGRRHVGDIDMLVRRADVERADAVLQSGGLRRSRPDFPLTPLQTRQYLRLKPEFEYVREAPPVRVELLWRIEGLPESEDIWSPTVEFQVAGAVQQTLSPESVALHLFQHGARHGWFRLFWLVDVALLLQGGTLDWPRLATRARRLGIERSLFQGAALSEVLLGVSCPAALTPMPGEQAFIAALTSEACRQIARMPNENEGTVEWFRQAAYRIRLQRKLAAKFAVMAPHLFSPETWRMWRLPDRWFFLYYPATPFLWLWRRIRRRQD